MRLPATWLSHGYQATIAWIADMIGQVFLEAGATVSCEDMEGLVLIDELDMYLHPKWQVSFITTLKKVFPRMQFVATTHSPMVLTGLASDEILMLQLDKGGVSISQAPSSPRLLTGTEIYESLFSLRRSFPHDMATLLDEYARLASDEERSDADDARLGDVKRRLHDSGVEPGWDPAPRKGPA